MGEKLKNMIGNTNQMIAKVAKVGDTGRDSASEMVRFYGDDGRGSGVGSVRYGEERRS